MLARPILWTMAGFWLLTASPSQCVVIVSPNVKSITWRQGDPAPSNINIVIQISGTSFSSQVSANPAGWLAISPRSGTSNTVGILSFTPQGLTPGNYIGLITFTEAGSNLGNTATLQINLTVQVGSTPEPTISNAFTGYISHLADGGGWMTSMAVVNLTESLQRITIRFWGDNGLALALPVVGLNLPTGVFFDLAPHGMGTLQTSGAAVSSVTGWATVDGAPSVANGFTVSTTFKNHIAGRIDTEAVSPMLTASLHGYALPFDNSNGYTTGVALVNIGADGALLISVRDGAGNVVGSQTLTMVAGQHVAFSITDKFPITAGRLGTIEVPATTAIVGLRFSLSGAFTSIVPAERP